MGERDVATHEAHKFGAKFGAMIFVGANKMCHFVE